MRDRTLYTVPSPLLGAAVLFLVIGCSKPAAPAAPTPVVSAAPGGTSRCAEVRRRLVQYPNLMVEQEPARLSGAFPRIAPARRDTAFTVSFVVDTSGKPVISTFAVSRHVGTRFTMELRKSAVAWRYAPASAEGCAVARKVSHTVDTGRPRSRRSAATSGTHPARCATHHALRTTQYAPRTAHHV